MVFRTVAHVRVREAAGKPKKVALIASMRKLLGAIMSVARTKTPFVPRLTESV